MDGLVDLPFALPTAVAGIALTTLYASNGWLDWYCEALGIRVAYTPLGIIIALTFIGLPFVVRTVEPVLQLRKGADVFVRIKDLHVFTETHDVSAGDESMIRHRLSGIGM